MVDVSLGDVNPGTMGAVSAALDGTPPVAAPETKVDRDPDSDTIPQARKDLVEKWCNEIRADKKYYEKVFKRMREDMEYARLGADKGWVDGKNYVVPIINRFINQAVASLYAKNPKAQAKRKPKLLYTAWDGTQEQASAALQLVQSGGDATGEAAEILQDVQNAQNYDKMMKRMGRTLEILFEYFTGEDFPDFKKRIKAAVRRTKTTGVSYVEVSFHRAMEPDPDVVARIGDMQAELNLIQSRQADLKDGELDEDDPKAEELREMLKTLEEEKMRIVIEGAVFDFPRSTDIIPHRACTALSGFIGCDYVTREYMMTPDEIQEMFKKDIKNQYKVYMSAGGGKNEDSGADGGMQEGDRGDTNDADISVGKTGKKDIKGKACVWRVMNKKTRQILWLCEGYPDFLREPAAPESQVHGFWTIFPLIFNEVEDEKEVYPPSDVNYLKDPQQEFNSARQGMREHRKASRPKFFIKRGVLEDEDKAALESAPAFAVIELGGIEGDMPIEKLIQAYRGAPIDPNMYETGSIMKDVLYGVGAQSADLGQTSDSSATESSIAEQSRMSTLASNVDDLDEFLSEIARATSQVLLQQMSQQSVIEIVGPGAVWPELNAEQIAKELYLEVKAGSSGRPNQQAELAALERAMQFLIQLGHISPAVLARRYCDLLNLDEDEFIVEGMPSIIALNAMAQQHAQAVRQVTTDTASATVNAQHAKSLPAPAGAGGGPASGAPQPHAGTPATNPNNQGSAGHMNMPMPAGVTPGAQPAYPAPTAHVAPPLH